MSKKKITAQEAKELTLEVWRYLAAHPELDNKRQLPDELYKKISGMDIECPLCELFYVDGTCLKCPLKSCIGDSPYNNWCYSFETPNPKRTRKKAAKKIVAILKTWRPENE